MLNQKKYFGFITVLFAIILLIGFASCGKSDNQTSDTKNMDKKEVKNVSKTIDSTEIGPIYTCPMHPEVLQNYPGTCPKCKMDLVKKEDQSAKIEGTLYTCPMHPKVIANYKGKCPLCKMDLEEMHNHK
jgi:transcription initiation factor IIE alpha subunit